MTDVRIAIHLCAYHLRSLEKMELTFREKSVFWDESPDYFHPDRSSPFWANGPLKPLLKALKGFVHEVHWLKELMYDMDGQHDYVQYNAANELWNVENFVKQRTLERKVKEDEKREEESVKALEKGLSQL